MLAEGIPELAYLASPRANCAGVDRAIRMTEDYQVRFGDTPVYVYHEIVHNRNVVRKLKAAGTVFVDDLEAIPDGAPAIYSAHGVSPAVRERALQKGLAVKDATCPLVRKIHDEIKNFVAEGRQIILVGHHGHDETVGSVGEAPDKVNLVTTVEDVDRLEVENPDKLALLTQTTLSVDDTKLVTDAIRRRFPNIIEPRKEDICFATQNRQYGVRAMISRGAEAILVLGSQNSSNSQRLREVAMGNGARGYLFDDIHIFQIEWIIGTRVIGVTAGASVIEDDFSELVDHLREIGIQRFETVTVADEGLMTFK